MGCPRSDKQDVQDPAGGGFVYRDPPPPVLLRRHDDDVPKRPERRRSAPPGRHAATWRNSTYGIPLLFTTHKAVRPRPQAVDSAHLRKAIQLTLPTDPEAGDLFPPSLF